MEPENFLSGPTFQKFTPPFFFPKSFQNYFSYSSSLPFHVNFRIFHVLPKSLAGILVGIVLNFCTGLERMDILRVLSLPFYNHVYISVNLDL